jgi:hypothetical protein
VVAIELLSMPGERILLRNEGTKEKGSYTVQITANQMPPGVYILILKTGDGLSAKRMVILK